MEMTTITMIKNISVSQKIQTIKTDDIVMKVSKTTIVMIIATRLFV